MASEIVTVFEDAVEFNVKHPLQNRWTLWYDDSAGVKQNPKLSWDENLKNVLTFDNIEDFFGLYKHLKNASEIPAGANYHLFKEGVRPAWEDPVNKNGGKWTFSQLKTKRGPELDRNWLHTVVALLGEQFTYNDDISGAVISIRKAGDRIAVWTRSCEDKEKTLKTGMEFKKILGCTERLGFQSHVDTAVKNSRLL
jgi:translation initiation factor 4E